ncbi:hypothetical protein [Serratia fonticola]
MAATPQLPDTAIVDDLIGTLAKYGWNVDRRSLSPILVVILTQNKAHKEVSEMCSYYLEDPERLLIERAMDNKKAKSNE